VRSRYVNDVVLSFFFFLSFFLSIFLLVELCLCFRTSSWSSFLATAGIAQKVRFKPKAWHLQGGLFCIDYSTPIGEFTGTGRSEIFVLFCSPPVY
jgi:hypothetical protein